MPMREWRRAWEANAGERFADGNMADVMRLGDVVIRARSPWSAASHAVLRHLEGQGFAGSPRIIDSDDEIEVLSFLPGEWIPPNLDGFRDDAILVTIARAVRTLHVALQSFQPPPGVEFPRMPGAPAADVSVCHNDLAPWNTIMRAGTFAGFVDWDLVTLATPLWDLAYAAWRFVPLYPDESSFGTAAERARRLRTFLDAYGLPLRERGGFVPLIRQRQVSGFTAVEEWGRAGVPGYARLLREGLHRGVLDDIAWLDRHADRMQRAIV